MQRVQMAGHRLTDPVLSGRPQNLNPPQVLSAPQPSSSEPGRGLCVDQCAGFHCDATAPARLLPLSITLSSTVHPSTIPYKRPWYWFSSHKTRHTIPYGPMHGDYQLPDSVAKAVSPPPLEGHQPPTPVTDDRCLKQIHTSLYLFCQYHFHHN